MFFSRAFALGLVASLASAASPVCPTCNGLTYNSASGAAFIIECGLDRAGGDLSMSYVSSFASCLDLCGSTTGCVDVSYAGTACYLKSKVVSASSNSVVWGARLASAALPSTSSSSSSTATSTSSVAASTSTSSALTCPGSNGVSYTTTGGQSFTVECGMDRAGGDLSMSYVNSLSACIAACASTTGCVDVSYVQGSPGPCYLKNSIKSAVANSNVWGAVMASSASSTSTSSSSSSSTSSSSSSSSAVPTTSTTTTSSQGAVTPAAAVAGTTMSTSTISKSSITSSSTSTTAALSSSATISSASSSASSSTSASTSASVSSSSSTSSTAASSSSIVSGCGLALPAGQTAGGSSQTVSYTTTDGLVRSYLVNIPANYNAKAATPLLFSFHGAGATSANQEAITGFSTSAINPNMIVVYPQGVNGYWQGAPYSTVGVNDVSFTQQLLSNLTATYCVDTSRVFVSGMSNGGGFTGTLACDSVMSTKVAAFGAHSGAFYPGGTDANCVPTAVNVACTPGRAHVPFLEIHGNADGQISYTGGSHNGECMPNIPTYIQEWAALDSYNSGNVTTALGNGNMMYQFGESVGGQAGVLTHIMVSGLGHSWASSFNGFSSSPVMISFFNEWTLTTAL